MNTLKKHFLIVYLLISSSVLIANCNWVIKDLLNYGEIPLLIETIDSIEKCGLKNDSLGMIYRQLGILYFNEYCSPDNIIQRTTSLNKGIQAAENCLAIWDKSGFDDYEMLTYLHENLGMYYYYKKSNNLSEVNLFKAIEYCQKINALEDLARINWRLGQLYLNNRFEYELATNYYHSAIKIVKPINNTKIQIDCLIGLGKIFADKNDFHFALNVLQQADLIIKNDNYGKELILINTGAAYHQLNDWDNAEYAYKKAINLSSSKNPSSNLPFLYSNLGNTLRKKGDYEKAIKNFDKGYKISQKKNNLQALAQYYNNTAEVYFDQKDYQTALEYFHKAVTTLIPGYEGNEGILPTKLQLASAIHKLDLLIYLPDEARALHKLYETTGERKYLEQAQSCFLLTDKLIDLIRFQHTDTDSKLFWRKKVKPIYEQALAIAFELKDYENAYLFFEKSKSILLLDAFYEADARQGISEEIQEKEYQLKAILINAQKEKDSEGELIASQNLNQFIDELAKDYPKYHELKYRSEILLYEKARTQSANSKHLNLHWFMGEKEIYLLAFNEQEQFFERLANSEDIRKQLQQFFGWFKESYLIDNEPQEYVSQAHSLFKKLFQNSDSNFNLDNYESLTIFADDLLNFLPFNALVTEAPSTDFVNFSKVDWLIKRVKTSYAYSATILNQQKKNATEYSQSQMEIFGFAPFLNKGSEAPSQLSSADLLFLKDNFEGNYFLGEAAQIDIFSNLNFSNALIHLSTHATAGTNTKDCQIFFYKDTLQLADLYIKPLPADLVVLSACETGIGAVAKGEGLLSLSRGFTHAGAASFIAGLWKVNDSSTSNILSDFYANSENDLMKSTSLHQAILTYLDDETIDMKSPYYWSGLVFSGADNILAIKHISPFWNYLYWIFGGLLLITSGLFFKTNLIPKI